MNGKTATSHRFHIESLGQNGQWFHLGDVYDHKHASAADKRQLYEFKDASQLMADFWDEVNNYLDKVNS